MIHYAAFLRGINVGGHRVEMRRLRHLFADAGLATVDTFIASGNVVFVTDDPEREALERRLERTLRDALGYDVPTFLRTAAEVIAIARHDPFAASDTRPGDTVHVVFMHAAPDESTRRRVLGLATEQDLLAFEGLELYWLRRGRLMDSTVVVALGTALARVPTTMRTRATLHRMIVRYWPAMDPIESSVPSDLTVGTAQDGVNP